MFDNSKIVRYSTVWEDYRCVQHIIQDQKVESILIIASGGENIFNLLALNDASICAFDANPIQIALVEIKMNAMQLFGRDKYLSFLGLNNEYDRSELFAEYESEYGPIPASFYPKIHEYGLMLFGRLEGFLFEWSQQFKNMVDRSFFEILECSDLERQKELFDQYMTEDIKDSFLRYFDAKNVGENGRHPDMYNYVEVDEARELWNRFRYACTELPVRGNFYLEFFLSGKMGRFGLPIYLSNVENYERTRKRLNKVQLHTGRLDELQLKEEFDVAVLSDIFEYGSVQENQKLFEQCVRLIKDRGVLCYWNLYVDFKGSYYNSSVEYLETQSNYSHSNDRSWFYGNFIGEKVKSKK